MLRVELTVEISGVVGASGPVTMAATAFLPSSDQVDPDRPVVFALPGGGYGRRYYDLNLPGHNGYSQARHHTDRGWVFVAIDHLGVGESSPEVCQGITIDQIAAANHLAVEKISERLADGRLVDGYPCVRAERTIGIGQSMGGGLTVIMTGRHRTYDAIAVLGYSAVHTVLPLAQADETARVSESLNFSRQHSLDELPDDAPTRIPSILYPFYYDDVPSDIVELDTRGGYPIRTASPDFGSLTLPHCVAGMLSEGFIRDEAAAIDVPTFLGFGSRDVAPDPHSEPAAYPNARDITLSIVEKMAHMHNFAGTRNVLWDRLTGWYSTVESAAHRPGSISGGENGW